MRGRLKQLMMVLGIITLFVVNPIIGFMAVALYLFAKD